MTLPTYSAMQFNAEAAHKAALYDEKQLADARCKVLGEDYDYAWFDEVQLGDLDLCNR